MTATTEGWTGWNGGACPLDKDAVVDIRLRSGREIISTAAGRWNWSRPRKEETGKFVASDFLNGGVVMAYRREGEAA